jgi:hypothetical protein
MEEEFPKNSPPVFAVRSVANILEVETEIREER